MFSQKLYDKSKLKIKTTIQFDKLKIFEKQFFLHYIYVQMFVKKLNLIVIKIVNILQFHLFIL